MNGLTAPMPADRIEGEYPKDLSDEPIKPLKSGLYGKRAPYPARIFKIIATLATLVWPSYIVTSLRSPRMPTDQVFWAQLLSPDHFHAYQNAI